MKFNVQKAKREQVYTKLALMSPSGGGKTYSALKVATGMAQEIENITGKKAKILMGNTEGSRGRYYANEFEYDIVDLEAPYSPELYIEFIDYAVEEGYDILILDSTSPEWEGTGGCLELHALAGGQYQHWQKITPRHEKFLGKIADSPIHIIATMRGKDQYALETDEKGKLSVKKLGVGSKQRDGFEYEFTCTFLLDQKTHIAEAQKDNTHIFEGEVGTVLSESHGARIIKWANDGEVVEAPKIFKPTSAEAEAEREQLFENMKNTIKDIAMAMNEKGIMDKYQYVVNLRLGEGRKVNSATIDDMPKLELILEDLKDIKI